MRKLRTPKDTTIVRRLYKGGLEATRLEAWRADLVREIGGEESLTLAKREMVEQACRIKVALDRMDLSPRQTDIDLSKSTTLRRALLYTFKLLGMSADRRVSAPRPRSRLAEIREEYAKGIRGESAAPIVHASSS